MRRNLNNNNSNKKKSESSNGFLPNSFKLISSCIKTVSSNVRSASASVAGSIAADADDLKKDQVFVFPALALFFSSFRCMIFFPSFGISFSQIVKILGNA